MANSRQNGSRLDSWKAIAAHLNRDERTVRRWEREQGLPVRRVPGGRGASVFAYASDLDAWLNARGASAGPASKLGSHAALAAAGALLTLFVWIAWRALPAGMPASVELAGDAVIARDGNGKERWRHVLAAGETFARPDARPDPVELVASPERGVLVATSHWVRSASDSVRSGELRWLSASGALRRTFSLDDRLSFGGTPYGAPWGITDFRSIEEDGSRRIAIAAHHFQWWPSVITVLDRDFRRLGTFVNAGWLERVHWLSSDRLLVAGYNEAIDGGVVALLDANALNGQVPLPSGLERFACDRCGADRPLRYVVMPRSEVNRAANARFNRATLQLSEAGFVVRTIEMPIETGEGADAIYEFDRSLNLLRASFSSRYWEMHRALQMQGRLDHARETCPDRHGPRALQVWDPANGWRVQ